MNRFIPISLVLSLFFSITGYMIPCTLHCMHSSADTGSHNQSEMDHNHDTPADHECDGVCSVEHLGSAPSNHHNSTGSTAMQLSHFMAQVLTAALCNELNIPPPVSAVNPEYSHFLKFNSWILTPPVPPPRFLPSV